MANIALNLNILPLAVLEVFEKELNATIEDLFDTLGSDIDAAIEHNPSYQEVANKIIDAGDKALQYRDLADACDTLSDRIRELKEHAREIEVEGTPIPNASTDTLIVQAMKRGIEMFNPNSSSLAQEN